MPNTLIVIGGSGDIGRAICRKAPLLKDISVCVHYFKNKDAADNIVKELAKSKVDAISLWADLKKPDTIITLFDACESNLGPVQYLVNASAIQGKRSSFLNVEYDELINVVTTNLTGVFVACQEALKRMIENRTIDCSIVNISSQAALHGSPNEWIHYACSKAGIDTLTKGLSKEFGKNNIRVNAIRPGLIDTKIHSTGGASDRLVSKLNEVSLGRIGTTEEIADLAYFLLTNRSSYITGSIIDINGGRL